MKLSIVITTYNRRDTLRALLSELEEQNDDNFEVVVAIDGSTDGTERMLENLITGFSLKVVDTQFCGYGLALARNRGILASSGEAVVIIDDDSRPCRGFVKAHRQSAKPDVLTGGPRDPGSPSASRMVWKMQELRRLPPLTPMDIDQIYRDWPLAYLVENNTCMMRKDWISVGLFSERVRKYGYIGQEFFARLRYLGIKYQFNPNAGIVHHGALEGDNGFLRSQKTRQTMMSSFMLPTMASPKYFDAQVAWARSLENSNEPAAFPSYRSAIALALPFRIIERLFTRSGKFAMRRIKSMQGFSLK